MSILKILTLISLICFSLQSNCELESHTIAVDTNNSTNQFELLITLGTKEVNKKKLKKGLPINLHIPRHKNNQTIKHPQKPSKLHLLPIPQILFLQLRSTLQLHLRNNLTEDRISPRNKKQHNLPHSIP